MTAAAMFGGVLGLAIGCAYLGGSAAKATTVRAQAERLKGATSAGFTEEALSAAAGRGRSGMPMRRAGAIAGALAPSAAAPGRLSPAWLAGLWPRMRRMAR